MMPPFVRSSHYIRERFIVGNELMTKAHYIHGLVLLCTYNKYKMCCSYAGRKYIACSGPTRASVYDFWSMVVQEQVKCIIMLNQPFEERHTPQTHNLATETMQV
jgi:hypothetical protein